MVNGEALLDKGSIVGTQRLEIYDPELEKFIEISLDQPCDLYYFQLKTLSQSEHGFDLSVQGISFAMVVPFSGKFCVKGSLEVRDV